MAPAPESVLAHGSVVSGAMEPGTQHQRTRWQEIVRARTSYFLLLPIFTTLIVFVYYPPL
ncbi:MAG: hypothetical protein JWO59_1901, partial [Chloroflexi bacterium]|nr:hypothetical protein [Chloroflexota bacterium]